LILSRLLPLHTPPHHTPSARHGSQNSTKLPLFFLISAHAKFFALVSRSLNPSRFVPCLPSIRSSACLSVRPSISRTRRYPFRPILHVTSHSTTSFTHCVLVLVRRIAKYGKLAAKFVTDSNVNAQAKGVAAGELTRTRTRTRTPRIALSCRVVSCRVVSCRVVSCLELNCTSLFCLCPAFEYANTLAKRCSCVVCSSWPQSTATADTLFYHRLPPSMTTTTAISTPLPPTHVAIDHAIATRPHGHKHRYNHLPMSRPT
jgi:hypothetical protein